MKRILAEAETDRPSTRRAKFDARDPRRPLRRGRGPGDGLLVTVRLYAGPAGRHNGGNAEGGRSRSAPDRPAPGRSPVETGRTRPGAPSLIDGSPGLVRRRAAGAGRAGRRPGDRTPPIGPNDPNHPPGTPWPTTTTSSSSAAAPPVMPAPSAPPSSARRSLCVEKDKLGGICLNWGCIPTKALLTNAHVVELISRHGKSFGYSGESSLGLRPDDQAQPRRHDQDEQGDRGPLPQVQGRHKAGTAKVVGPNDRRRSTARRSPPSRSSSPPASTPEGPAGGRVRRQDDHLLQGGDGPGEASRSRCSSSAPGRSAASSPTSTTPSAPR